MPLLFYALLLYSMPLHPLLGWMLLSFLYYTLGHWLKHLSLLTPLLGKWPAGIQTLVRGTYKPMVLTTHTAVDEFIQNKFSVGMKLAAPTTCSPTPTPASTVDLFNAQRGLIHVPRVWNQVLRTYTALCFLFLVQTKQGTSQRGRPKKKAKPGPL